MADTPSKSRKKKLRLIASGAHQRRAARVAIPFITGVARPVCKMDEKAKELGVYNAKFHAMIRKDRKSIVSKALTEQRKAA